MLEGYSTVSNSSPQTEKKSKTEHLAVSEPPLKEIPIIEPQ